MFSIGTPEGTRDLSFEMSFVLIGMYLMNVAVTLCGGVGGTSLPEDQALPDGHREEPLWRSGLVLVAAAIALGVITEVLSHALEPTAKRLGLSNTFSGLVLLGGAGSLGEVLSGFHFARRGKPSLVLAATVGSSIQLVLLVAPLLVFAGRAMGQPMDLAFTPFEVVAIVLATIITRELISDGQATWFEGFLLLGVYLILAIGFFHLPE
jgi:Ca2+:H+ antiporter